MDTVEQEETAEKEKKKREGLSPISKRWSEFLDHYFEEDVKFNGTEAYSRTYPNVTREAARRNAVRLLSNADIQAHVAARFAEHKMSADEAVRILSSQARAKIHVFYKESTRWTFEPLPTEEIIEERESIDNRDKKNPKVRQEYQVRCLVLDMKKVLDPQLSHLIKKISDNPRTGLTIELYDSQSANDMVLKVLGGYKNTLALTNPDGSNLIPPNDKDADAEYRRSISELANAIREIIPGSGAEAQSQMGTPE